MQALAIAVLFVDAVVASTVGAAGGRAEGVQWDVGGLACTVAADGERNLGGRRGCSGPSPAMEVVVVVEVRTELLRKAGRRWDGWRNGTWDQCGCGYRCNEYEYSKGSEEPYTYGTSGGSQYGSTADGSAGSA